MSGTRAGVRPAAGAGQPAQPGRRVPAGSAPVRGAPARGTQHGRLRLTRRGAVVLGTGALLVVAVLVWLVVLVARLLAGPGAEAVTPVAVPDPACVPTASTSQNCWPVFADGADPLLEISPWVTGRLRGGDVRTVLDHVASRFDAEVEPVDVDSSWGWANRSVRGEGDDEGGLSNHASGTSIDLNATEHPLGARETFTDRQVEAIRSILVEVAPVVAWGGDFGGRADEMHFEIVGNPAAVAEVAARLRGETPPG